ncbi:MAG TPA: hypothetical protein VFA66_04970 [Gaiellaceae bacterium]|nr:hypothetical protein [Gaiellaceae bacterium]
MATSEPHQLQRELAHRAGDGIEVVLFWHQLTNDLTVCVSDQQTGAYFELAADPGHALDVFEHPYAYAATRGMRYDEALLASWVDAAAAPAPAFADRAKKPAR